MLGDENGLYHQNSFSVKFNGVNVSIGKNVIIGKNVRIGDNSTIHDNVTLEDGVTICDYVIIGEPSSAYYKGKEYVNPPTIIGENSLIRSFALVHAGAKLSSHVHVGHRATIREFSVIGEHTMIGMNTELQGNLSIGKYCRFQSFISVGKGAEIGDFVFVYPYCVFTNDPLPPSYELKGCTIGNFTQICTSSIIMPGTIIGEHSLIGAMSKVGGTFEDDSFIDGNPAKRIGKLSKMPFFNESDKRHYPWPYHYSNNMPWEKVGYEAWLVQNS